MFLETERVQLRHFTREDEDNLFELDSDPEVMRYLTNGVPSTREWIKGAMDRTLALKEKHQGRLGVWAAMDKESGQFMGWFMLRPDKHDPENIKRVELGYRLKRSFWGKGIATEVSKALVSKGFKELGVEEVYALTFITNVRSQRVMQKTGLRFVREFFNPDYPEAKDPDVEYSLTREEYFSRSGLVPR